MKRRSLEHNVDIVHPINKSKRIHHVHRSRVLQRVHGVDLHHLRVIIIDYYYFHIIIEQREEKRKKWGGGEKSHPSSHHSRAVQKNILQRLLIFYIHIYEKYTEYITKKPKDRVLKFDQNP